MEALISNRQRSERSKELITTCIVGESPFGFFCLSSDFSLRVGGRTDFQRPTSIFGDLAGWLHTFFGIAGVEEILYQVKLLNSEAQKYPSCIRKTAVIDHEKCS